VLDDVGFHSRVWREMTDPGLAFAGHALSILLLSPLFF
jgi:hypothetical protein